MNGMKRIDQFDTDKYYFRLNHFPGDNTYTISRMLKSNTVTRGEIIFSCNNENEARKSFNDLKKRMGGVKDLI